MSRLGQRLGTLENTARSQRADFGPAFLIVSPDDWPAEDRAAFDAAGAIGDRMTRSALVAKHAGQAPGLGTTVIVIRDRTDGPQ